MDISRNICELDYDLGQVLLAYIAEVKNEWSYTSTPPICLCGLGRAILSFYLRF